MRNNVTVSVIVPCYNEAKKIEFNIRILLEYLESKYSHFEVIAVNDGSSDNTAKILNEIQNEYLIVMDNGKNIGKGYSVRQGMLRAKGDIILYTDADLSTPVEEIEKAVTMLLSNNYDLLVGSRRGEDSRVDIDQPWYRIMIGSVFRRIRDIIIPLDTNDSQCGFKCLKREAVQDIIPRQRIDRFAFDVEMLFLAKQLGYKIETMQVAWRNDTRSSVKIIRDSFNMMIDLLRIRWMHRSVKKERCENV